MPMVEDLSLFFDAAEFGTEVQIGSADVLGLLERGYHEVAGIATTDPTFTCAAADADSTGLAVLLLQAACAPLAAPSARP